MMKLMQRETADSEVQLNKERKMKVSAENMRLYAVTDRKWCTDYTLEQQVEDALKGGITFLQLREKNISDEEYIEIAGSIKKLTDRYNIPFVINDNVKAALAVNADGVHLGQNDTDIRTARKLLGENKIIGATARTPQQAIKAYNDGADYLGTGALFATSTKSDAVNISIEQLNEVCRSVPIPVTAIGGINENNVLRLRGCEADGIAVVSAVFSKKNIEEAVKNLRNISESIFGNRK